MAQGSAPVALGLGGLAAIFLISGVQGKSIGSIIQGDFGKAANPAFGGTGSSGEESGSGSGGSGESHSAGSSPFGSAPSPTINVNPVKLYYAEQVVKKDFPHWSSKQVRERAEYLVKEEERQSNFTPLEFHK